MGHAEMLLAVAGLNELQVEERVKVLASGDWSSFKPEERVLLRFAKQLSQRPQQLNPTDVQLVIRNVGLERTLHWTFHIGWCNFMTRIADSFQIPLEKENIFHAMAPPKPPPSA